jgi:hypothetical protein
MASERLKAVLILAMIGFVVVGILGFILGAIFGGAAQAEGKDITWLIGGVLGAIAGAITGVGCGAILALQAVGRSSKDASSKSHNDPSIPS